ncbi:MAG: hypothetical protein WC554_02850 [Clostridia bacterium]|jgi:hypothetical protein
MSDRKQIAITKDNFDEVAKIYESISEKLTLSFTSYYKYSFSFIGQVGDISVYASYGGDSDDIYKFYVESNKPEPAPKTLKELFEEYFYICITDTDKNIEYTSYHY